MERTQAILQTGALQIRPVLMTCVIAGVGLLPAAISTGIGSQVQKPLAIVVVSGMTLAPILILTVLPALIAFFPTAHLMWGVCKRRQNRPSSLKKTTN